jgi:hypothetical protein
MDLEFGSHRAHGRERLTRLEFPAEKGFLRGEYHLIKDGLSRPKRESE